MRKQTKIIMGMPISIEVIGEAKPNWIAEVFAYFWQVDRRFSTYKTDSEISRINRGLAAKNWSPEMKRIMKLCEHTKSETNGYFDIEHQGQLDPSGLVKGWSVHQAARMLRRHGIQDFMLEAGGDIEAHGRNQQGQLWRVGIRNPFNRHENVKIIQVDGLGVATSGTYIRGQHVYNPKQPAKKLEDIASLTVVGPNIYEADRMATAAFAMGRRGIGFIEKLKGFEGYSIDRCGLATLTSGFESYVV